MSPEIRDIVETFQPLFIYPFSIFVRGCAVGPGVRTQLRAHLGDDDSDGGRAGGRMRGGAAGGRVRAAPGAVRRVRAAAARRAPVVLR